MELPTFLALTPLSPAPSPAQDPPGKKLPFTIEAQVPRLWCWAATSNSVSHYYNPQSSWTQCEIANEQLNRHDCCPTLPGGSCDHRGDLDKALRTTGNLGTVHKRVTFAEIQNEINANRPLGCRLDWGNAGHFVVIYGWQLAADQSKWVDIGDPLHSDSCIHLPLSTFTNSYQTSGRWTDTYYTRASA